MVQHRSRRRPLEIDPGSEPLSNEEFEQLDELFDEDAIEDGAMGVPRLHGFLTALVIGPRAVEPGLWLPFVWDMEEGEREPPFTSMRDADDMLGLIARLHNNILATFEQQPDRFEPLYEESLTLFPIWYEGFLFGTLFAEEDWNALREAHAEWLPELPDQDEDDSGKVDALLDRLEAAMDAVDDAEDDDTLAAAQADLAQVEDELLPLPREAVHAFTERLPAIHAWWRKRRDADGADDDAPAPIRLAANHSPARNAQRDVGRNDPCPCGSGRKYKKCHGA